MEFFKNIMDKVNLKDKIGSLTGKSELKSKVADMQDDNDVKEFVSTVSDALKDKKLSTEEKQDLGNRLKSVATNLFKKK